MTKNLTAARLGRIAACRADLMGSRIDVAGLDDRDVTRLVREQIEYFQMMLGDESTPAQVLALIRRDLDDAGPGIGT